MFIPMPESFQKEMDNPKANYSLCFNKWVKFGGDFSDPKKINDDESYKRNKKNGQTEELIRLEKLYKKKNELLSNECKKKEGRVSSMLQSLEQLHYKVALLKCKVNDVLISGMGNEHVLENSINLDWCTGLPYIPASSIKGVTSYAARFDEEQNKAIQGNPDGIFGSQTGMGEAIFFDGFPLHVPTLKIDIMNNHYPNYYSTPEKEFPSDDQKPIPITFLVVNEGAEFYFPVAARDGAKLKKAIEFLKSALSEWGVGAKTSVGYGIFKEFEEISLEKIASPSGLMKNFEEFRFSPSPENFKKFIEEIRPDEVDELKNLSFENMKESINIGFVAPLIECEAPEEIKKVLAIKLLQVIEKSKKWKGDKLEKYNKLKSMAE